MHKHINLFSFFGSFTAVFGWIGWIQTLSLAALIISMAAGIVTIGYTLFKWRRDIKKDHEKNQPPNN